MNGRIISVCAINAAFIERRTRRCRRTHQNATEIVFHERYALCASNSFNSFNFFNAIRRRIKQAPTFNAVQESALQYHEHCQCSAWGRNLGLSICLLVSTPKRTLYARVRTVSFGSALYLQSGWLGSRLHPSRSVGHLQCVSFCCFAVYFLRADVKISRFSTLIVPTS